MLGALVGVGIRGDEVDRQVRWAVSSGMSLAGTESIR